jgi:hypothetical protein
MNPKQKNNNNVIGPISKVDWDTLLMVRSSLKYMREHNDGDKFKSALVKEAAIYKSLLSEYVPNEPSDKQELREAA